MRQVEISSAARADIQRVFVWYESQREGLGEHFVECVREAVELVALNPEGYAKIVGEARKANLKTFPYALFFKIKGDVLVIACLHHKRSPDLAKELAAGITSAPET